MAALSTAIVYGTTDNGTMPAQATRWTSIYCDVLVFSMYNILPVGARHDD
jgi:hypothetical protein